MQKIQYTINEHLAVIQNLGPCLPVIERVAERLVNSLQHRGKILWAGNGGSAADSQHYAAELVGRFSRDRSGIASVALTTDTSALTAIANDFGYDQVFSRQVEAIGNSNDILVAISTSGNSKNLLRAVEVARKMEICTIAMTGKSGGLLKPMVDECILVPSEITARVQEAHLLIGHILCDWIEAILSNDHREP